MTFSISSKSMHPYLIGIIPIANLYYHNYTQVSAHEVLLIMMVVCVLIYALSRILRLIVGRGIKTNVLLSLIVILFFTYGAMDDVLNGLYIRQRYLLIVWAVMLIIIVYSMKQSKGEFRFVNRYLNITSVVLVMIIIFRLALSTYSTAHAEMPSMENDYNGKSGQIQNNTSAKYPDIYYIILDGMAGAQTFKDVFDYDNPGFIRSLRDRGFYVASKSHSNYVSTMLSLASSLNMKYMDELHGYDEEAARHIAYTMIKDNEVARRLRSKGYKIINVRSGWGVTDYNRYADRNIYCGILNEFVNVLMERTPLAPFFKYFIYKKEMRDRIVTIFAKIPQIGRDDDRPNYIFAHIVCPHPPYVFGRDGGWVKMEPRRGSENIWSRRDSYLDQAVYIMSKAVKMADDIEKNSTAPYVIIIQGDHGTAATFPKMDSEGWNVPSNDNIREIFDIFNAYYSSDHVYDGLYENITPVNSFEWVLNKFFNDDYVMREDRNYYSYFRKPFDFVDVTKSLK